MVRRARDPRFPSDVDRGGGDWLLDDPLEDLEELPDPAADGAAVEDVGERCEPESTPEPTP